MWSTVRLPAGPCDDLMRDVACFAHPIQMATAAGTQDLHDVNDEVGSRIGFVKAGGGVQANVKTAAVFDYLPGGTFTAIWPVQPIVSGDQLLRAP